MQNSPIITARLLPGLRIGGGFYPKSREALPSGAEKDYVGFCSATIDHREKFNFMVADVPRRNDLSF